MLLTLAGCTGPGSDTGSSQGTTDPPTSASGSSSGGSGAPAPDPAESAQTPVPSASGSGDGGSQGGIEVLPESSPTPSSLADLFPSDQPSAGRLKTPPANAVATSGLAAGFPKGVLFVPENARVVSSAVTTNDSRSQLTLGARVPHQCRDILADLRVWYTTGGFVEGSGTRETPARADLRFVRDDGHVMVVAVTKGDTCRLTESGVLTAGAGS
jgi:hypothetical protein